VKGKYIIVPFTSQKTSMLLVRVYSKCDIELENLEGEEYNGEAHDEEGEEGGEEGGEEEEE